jgi:S1 RNA binding domain protein
MQLEIGTIAEGKVTGITKFGAFVELEPGTSGMVHISEVANRYINDISEVLTVGQNVNVKIISVSDDGKIALSIKKTEPVSNHGRFPDSPVGQREDYNNNDSNNSRPSFGNRSASGRMGGNRQSAKSPATFEDMMNAFKKTSDEKLGDIKRQGDKRGGRR